MQTVFSLSLQCGYFVMYFFSNTGHMKRKYEFIFDTVRSSCPFVLARNDLCYEWLV